MKSIDQANRLRRSEFELSLKRFGRFQHGLNAIANAGVSVIEGLVGTGLSIDFIDAPLKVSCAITIRTTTKIFKVNGDGRCLTWEATLVFEIRLTAAVTRSLALTVG